MKHFIFINYLSKISYHMRRIPFLGKVTTLLNILRHKFIMKYINIYLNGAYYDLNGNEIFNKTFPHIIWLFWWQGKENMPQIVRMCFNSLKQNSYGYNVIFIDKYNIHKYAKLPKFIYYKMNKGLISFTEFSDILRCNLIKNYGGIWSDSTNFWTDNVNTQYFSKNHILITSGCKTKYRFFISSKWTVSLMGAYKNNPLFIFMNNFFLYYWKTNNYLISYNLIDYALYYAYNHNIGNFKFYVDKRAPYNNPQMFMLIKYMNKRYNCHIFKKLTTHTHVFKLTYKRNFINKRDTLYYELNHNNL